LFFGLKFRNSGIKGCCVHDHWSYPVKKIFLNEMKKRRINLHSGCNGFRLANEHFGGDVQSLAESADHVKR
jgi:hypothetical protein